MEDTYGLDPARIRVDKEQQLGKGNYGVVYRGTLATGLNDTAAAIDVAVKMLPQDRVVEERERQDFWEEATFLRHLECLGGHANVVEFIGYVAGEELMLLLEFAPGGSLLAHLRAKRDRSSSLSTLQVSPIRALPALAAGGRLR